MPVAVSLVGKPGRCVLEASTSSPTSARLVETVVTGRMWTKCEARW